MRRPEVHGEAGVQWSDVEVNVFMENIKVLLKRMVGVPSVRGRV